MVDAVIGEIYPSEASNRVSYLDILIGICGNKYVTEVYDKRDNFKINFPFMSSNIPANPTYGCIFLSYYRLVEYVIHMTPFVLGISCLPED